MTTPNRAYFSVSNTPSTSGNLTVSTAVAGPYRTLTAADDGLICSVSIIDGNAWEVRTGCVYTHSTTTLTRGTLEESSTGSAIDLTSSAKVMIVGQTADRYDKTPYVLARPGAPVLIPPSGTMAANGAVTFGTAIALQDGAVLTDGLWAYFPAGAVYAGSDAGFYWMTMSSTTGGTVYDTMYEPGVTSGERPSSPTAISAAGPGAYTGETATIVAARAALPGGALGLNGSLRVTQVIAVNNSANNKSTRTFINNTPAGGVTTHSSLVGHRNLVDIMAMGSHTRQWASHYFGVGSGGSTGYFITEDLSADATITARIAHQTAATDWVMLTALRIEVFPS
ncbi:MAG TPA: hypothetical protein PKD25_01550 [Rubrivivax sp.]|nr:hypothetical protein [Rubrivivax sp.]